MPKARFAIRMDFVEVFIMKLAYKAVMFVVIVVFTFILVPVAHAGEKFTLAYLDPGTGALIFQALIAGIVGASFAIKIFWKNIQDFFLRLSGKKTVDAEEPEQTPSEVFAQQEDDE